LNLYTGKPLNPLWRPLAPNLAYSTLELLALPADPCASNPSKSSSNAQGSLLLSKLLLLLAVTAAAAAAAAGDDDLDVTSLGFLAAVEEPVNPLLSDLPIGSPLLLLLLPTLNFRFMETFSEGRAMAGDKCWFKTLLAVSDAADDVTDGDVTGGSGDVT